MTGQADSRAAAQKLFDSLAQDFLDLPGVGYARMFASNGLKVNGKFFAFPGNEGRLILKLPEAQANALVADELAEPVELGKRVMREWVGVPLPSSGSGEWPRLMADAHRFVEALTTSPE
jgi:hypothetical protein